MFSRDTLINGLSGGSVWGLFLNHHNMTEMFQDIYHLECRDNSKVSELVKDGKKVRNVVEMGIK